MNKRTMTPVLAATLADLTDSERRLVIRLAEVEDLSPLLGRLFEAIRVEVMDDVRRQDDVLRALEADQRAEVEAVDQRLHGDPPPVDGRPATFDPATGEWVFE